MLRVKTKDVLKNVFYTAKGNLPEYICGITNNSNTVKKGFIYVAIPGCRTDGHNFIGEAAKKGASIAIVERFVENIDIPQIKVENARKVLSKISANFYGHPSKKLNVIGVTGTNGKTSFVYILSKILLSAEKKTGTIGTLGFTILDKFYSTDLTTPESFQIHSIMYKFVENGIEYAIMEVSSHSLELNRVNDIDFDVGVFTNISHDHLDFHKTMDAYVRAKTKLFQLIPEKGFCLINLDDRFAERFMEATKCVTYTYSISDYNAHFYWEYVQEAEDGIKGIINAMGSKIHIESRLSGKFNLYNILCSCACAHLLGIKAKTILKGVESIERIPGRLEEFRAPGKPRIFVDFAHTPDAFENVLNALTHLRKDKGNLITVFGCGGNRDRRKRPKMAKTAEKYSSLCIVTNDNPRFEDPDEIIKDILSGFSNKANYIVIKDRKEAIEYAIREANENDIIAILGKGHENYQEIKGVKHPYSDIDVVKELYGLK